MDFTKRNKSEPFQSSHALWARITKNTDWRTGPLARPLACSLAHSLVRLLYPARSACALCCAHSFNRSLNLLTRETMNEQMTIYSLFFFYFGP